MDFVIFARAHGILLDSHPPIGVWRRYATEDHPKSRNGAVKFMGDHGFVQNHATETEVSVWKPDSPLKFDYRMIAESAKNAELARLKAQKDAASKARWILGQCQYARHDYLKNKGFPDESVNVWVREGVQILVIPMYSGGQLVGCQLIDSDGTKKFLLGQKTSLAEFVFDNKGIHLYCEGYATALSVRMALKNRRNYTIHVCFSAGNLKKLAEIVPGAIIADNDESGTGERVAIETGQPYWMSDVVGEDANDYHQRAGLFKFSQSLTRSLKIF